MQGVVGKRRGCVVDASSVTEDVSGLVIISVDNGSVVGSMVVGNGAVVVTIAVEASVGVVVSIVMVVSTGGGGGVADVSVVVSGTEVAAVVTAAVGGGCVEGEVRGGGVEVTGDAGDGVDGAVTLVDVGVEGKVVEERVVGD